MNVLPLAGDQIGGAHERLMWACERKENTHMGEDDEKNGKMLSNEVEFNAVNYTEMIPILIAAVKEQNQIIEELKKEIELLKKSKEVK